jgi:hypothetical protein
MGMGLDFVKRASALNLKEKCELPESTEIRIFRTPFWRTAGGDLVSCCYNGAR